MIATPQTYSEWVTVLDKLKNKVADTDVLIAMQGGRLEWQSGVAERFVKRLVEAVNIRLNAASDKFQKDMSRIGGNENAIVQAILALRKELYFLTQVLNIPVIPHEQRQQLIDMVYEQANTMQKSLEDSSKRDRSGKLSSIVRNNKVNNF